MKMTSKWTITFLLTWSTKEILCSGDKCESSETRIENAHSTTFSQFINFNPEKSEKRERISILLGEDTIPKRKRTKRKTPTNTLNMSVASNKGKDVVEGKEFPSSLDKHEGVNADFSRTEGAASLYIHHHCSICNIHFRYNKEYDEHCKGTHGIDLPYTCVQCSRCFKTRNNLLRHFRTSPMHYKTYLKRDMSKPVHCEICGSNIEGGWLEFDRHARKLHKGMKILRCSQCPKKYNSRAVLTAHVRLKHGGNKGEQVLHCEFCKNIFDRTDELKSHREYCEQRQMKKRKGIIVLDCVKKNMKNVRIRCDECCGVFESFNVLKNHYRMAHPKLKLYPCDYCEEAFSREIYLEKHLDMRHADKYEDMVSANYLYRRKKVYACQYCTKELNTLGEYEKHGKEHPGKGMFYCKECRKEFIHRRSLWNHANEDHGDSNLKRRCPYCASAYFNGGRLNKHVKTCKKKAEKIQKLRENGGRGCYCKICEKTLYVSIRAFKHHRYRHQKYDVCTICDRGFNPVRFPTALAKHMAVIHPPKEEMDGGELEHDSIVGESWESEEIIVKREIKDEAN